MGLLRKATKVLIFLKTIPLKLGLHTLLWNSDSSGVPIRSIKALAPQWGRETTGSRRRQGDPGGVPAAEEWNAWALADINVDDLVETCIGIYLRCLSAPGSGSTLARWLAALRASRSRS